MSVQPAEIRQHLDRVLREESQWLAELEQLLQRETDIVRGDDPVAIEKIGGERQRCIETLTRLDAERSAASHLLSFGNGREAFEQLLAWCDPAGELRGRWLQNLQAVRRCKDVNERNGAVVALKLGQVQQLLATLRGGHSAAVYGRHGGRFEGFATRQLGQA